MVAMYVEEDMYRTLSNKELIEKQKTIDNKLSIAYGMSNSNSNFALVEQLNYLAEMINAEVMRRLEEGTMDEDELEDWIKNNI
jgi:hypothetical protein